MHNLKVENYVLFDELFEDFKPRRQPLSFAELFERGKGKTDAEDEVPILWLPDVKSWFIGKDPDAGKNWRQKKKGTTEDEMVGYQLNGHESEQTPGDRERQGSLECCSPWGHKE